MLQSQTQQTIKAHQQDYIAMVRSQEPMWKMGYCASAIMGMFMSDLHMNKFEAANAYHELTDELIHEMVYGSKPR